MFLRQLASILSENVHKATTIFPAELHVPDLWFALACTAVVRRRHQGALTSETDASPHRRHSKTLGNRGQANWSNKIERLHTI